jgi:glycosyltransferase involved in cell wall biosynthesis
MVSTAWTRRRDYEVAQVEVYSGNAFRWAEAVCWTLRRARKPYVLTLHGGNLPEFSARRPARVGMLLQSAALVTSPSRYLQETLAPYRADIRLLPNALDLRGYEFSDRNTQQPRLVWLRAFHSIYNPVLAVETLARLVPSHPEASLLMVGPDRGDGSLAATREAAERLGVSERLAIQPGVPKAEVPAWLQKGDIFLNTTDVDNTPVSVLEAQACGLCVVSTNVGGLPYLLEDGKDALLVLPHDAEAMAGAARRILTVPGLAARLSRNARLKAERYDWAVVLPQLEAILREVAGSVK